MNSSPNPETGPVCSAGPFPEGLQFQSSQPHVKRFIMFDHSGGKGRVFFHPALAQELFGPTEAQGFEIHGFTDDKVLAADQLSLNTEQCNLKLLAYKQVVEGAFTSLQSLRSSRHSDMACLLQPIDFETYTLRNPKVSEAVAVRDDHPARGIQVATGMASYSLVCGEKLKLSASLPSFKVAAMGRFSVSSSRQNGGTRPAPVASGLSHENTEDLDALLSSGEEDDDDDDVRSTGHSPEESSGKDERVGGEDGEEEVEQYPSKRRKVVEKPYERISGACAGDVVTDGPSLSCHRGGTPSNRRQKIKRTVKALRSILPGGAFLDATLILDETIRYVRSLRDRVNQLEDSLVHSQKQLNHHP